MTTHRLRRVAFILLAVIASSLAGSAVPPERGDSRAAGSGRLMAFGGRSAAQLRSGLAAKLDAPLADLARHLTRVRPGHELGDLRSLSPAARFAQPAHGEALVLIDAITRGDPQQLRRALLSLGLQHAAVYANDVGGWLPVHAIAKAAVRPELLAMRAAMPRTRAAPLATQGDFAQGSSALRTTYPTLSGTGVTVGVLSDSFNCYGVYDQPGSGVPASGPQGYAPNGFATDDATYDETQGYLPASADIDVVEEAPCLEYGAPEQLPFTDEGRAMLQVVHAVAPGAALSFYTASNSEADFANGIGELAEKGATVIADDTGYFDEPFFQDGILAEAIDDVAAKYGVAYFSAAGNNSDLSYENTAPSFGTLSQSAPNKGEYLLNFDTSGGSASTTLPVTIPPLFPGESIGLIVEWDQPYVTGAADSPGASSSIDLCVTGVSGSTQVFDLDGNETTCTGPNATGVDPVQVLILANPADASGNTASITVSLMVGLANGTAAPGRIKLLVYDDGAGSVINRFATNSPTILGHPGAASAGAVAAAFFAQTPLCGTSPAVLESFSSLGGTPILFNTSGERLATPQVRQKPDFTAPDGINTSFFGFFIAGTQWVDDSSVAGCQNDASYLNFFGTSAATPHAAGIAALALQAIPGLAPSLIIGALHATAAPMSGTTPNFESGYGFIQAQKLGAPVVWFPGDTVSVGNTTSLGWLALESTSCTASGSWSGAQPVSGTQTVTPAAVGSSTYTLTCVSSGGTQQQGSVTLQVVPALAITSTALPNGKVGTVYSATLSATGGVTPYTWSVASLPAGLSLNASTGAISGTPTAAASAVQLAVQVIDSERPTFSNTANVSLTIAAAPASGGGGGGGGGALGALTLLALSGFVCMRLARATVHVVP